MPLNPNLNFSASEQGSEVYAPPGPHTHTKAMVNHRDACYTHWRSRHWGTYLTSQWQKWRTSFSPVRATGQRESRAAPEGRSGVLS